jgi:hypothetical protein
MKIGPLSLFKRTNSRRLFNIAAYHSPHSLTWSWIVSASFDGVWRKPEGGLRIGIRSHRTNSGLHIVAALPFVVFERQRQREMWFRDLFRRARDREDELEERVSKLRRELTLARVVATIPETDPQ